MYSGTNQDCLLFWNHLRRLVRMRIQQTQVHTFVIIKHNSCFGSKLVIFWSSGTDCFPSSSITDDMFRNYLLPNRFLHIKHSYSVFSTISWQVSETIPFGCCWILVLHFTWFLVLPETSLHLAVKSVSVVSKVCNSLSLCHRCKIEPLNELLTHPRLFMYRREILIFLALADIKRGTKVSEIGCGRKHDIYQYFIFLGVYKDPNASALLHEKH